MMKKRRFSLTILIVVVFISAWIGEALIDFGYLSQIAPHTFFKYAIPIIFNAAILMLLFEKEFLVGQKLIEKKSNRLGFYLILVGIWTLINFLFIVTW